MYEWRDINWQKVKSSVFKLQKPIYKASQRGDVRTVRKILNLIAMGSDQLEIVMMPLKPYLIA